MAFERECKQLMDERSSIEDEKKAERFFAHNKYPKHFRIRKRKEYKKIFKQGKRTCGKFLYIDTLIENSSHPKLGITVSKRYGKAHIRNRFKRCVRESFRTLSPCLKKNLTINIIPRYKARFVKSNEICKEMTFLLSSYLTNKPTHDNTK